MSKRYDVIIIGGGVAGLTASIYTARGGLKTLIVEKSAVGGQAVLTYEIANFPGFENITGVELSENVYNQAKKLGVEFLYEEVSNIKSSDVTIELEIKNEIYYTNNLILALGVRAKKLGIENEEKFLGKGISYCATCDGGFFRKKTACVSGGGNTALEDALYLSKFAHKVYLIHRRDKFRAERALINAVTNSNINIIYDSVIKEINGENKLQSIVVRNNNTDESTIIPTDGLFVAIGQIPNTEILRGLIELDSNGYIITNVNMQTNVKNIYAIGDVRNTVLRQLITACSDGAIAGNHITMKDF